MSDRLAELTRQRALLQEHLAWLDREIAAAAASRAGSTVATPASLPVLPDSALARGSNPGPVVQPALVAAALPAVATARTTTSPLPAPDAILDEYRVAPSDLQRDVRKGCLLYFVLAFALVGIGVGLLYLLLSR